MKEIKDILDYVNSNNLLLNIDQIKKITLLICNMLNITLDNISIKSDNDTRLAQYHMDNNTIDIFINGIISYANDRNMDSNLIYNFYIVSSIFHELKHACQYKECFQDGYSLVKNVYILGFGSNKIELYESKNPIEVEAELFGLYSTLSLYGDYFDDIDVMVVRNDYFNLLRSLYIEDEDSLTNNFKLFCMETGKSDYYYREMNRLMRLDSNTKINLGLPLSYKEYDEFVEKLNRLDIGKCL